MHMFPLFLKLERRRCLVVGAGPIAESKIAGLLDAGAKVRVVAPEATPQVQAWARSRKIEWRRRAFQPADLQGMFLVVAATSSTALHERIFRTARRLRALCNVVDVPQLCDFYYPAVIRRGALQIAVSTGGHSPALAQRLRKELERHFGTEYKEWLSSVSKARKRIQARKLKAEQRTRLLHELVSEPAFEAFRKKWKNKQRRRRKSSTKMGRNA
jgi:precorrin-2 dehydrogenase / sirohydrochlorin ferrochelatase